MLNIDSELKTVELLREILNDVQSEEETDAIVWARHQRAIFFAQAGLGCWFKLFHPTGNGLKDRMLVIKELKLF